MGESAANRDVARRILAATKDALRNSRIVVFRLQRRDLGEEPSDDFRRAGKELFYQSGKSKGHSLRSLARQHRYTIPPHAETTELL